MKPFLGMDLTEDNRNTVANGQEFLVQELSEATREALDSSAETSAQLNEKSDVSKVLRIVRYVCGVVAGLAVISLMKSFAQTVDMPVSEMYHNAPWLFWGGGISGAAWIALRIIGDKKKEVVANSDEGMAAASSLDVAFKNALAELQVPDTAASVDILSFYYKENDGEIKLAEKPMQLFSHINAEFKVFADDENVYLADVNGKFAFPKASIKRIQTVQKKARLAQWNKEESFQSPTYAQYKMTADQFGSVHTKPYYIMEIEKDNTLWGVYFPCYELEQIEALVGLRAE